MIEVKYAFSTRESHTFQCADCLTNEALNLLRP